VPLWLQYKTLYITVTKENEQLRAENGDLLRGLNAHAEALRVENGRLQARLDRTLQELEKLRKLLAATNRAPVAAGVPLVVDHVEGGSEADLEGVGEGHNLFELRIEKGDLRVNVDVGTFFAVDFYDHPTQVPC
jgi:hypothetical protein